VADDSNIQQLNSRVTNLGQMYVTASGKSVAAKTVKLLVDCRKKCREWVSPEIQRQIHTELWTFSHDKKSLLLSSFMDIKPTSRKRSRSGDGMKDRSISVSYHLNIEGKNEEICRACQSIQIIQINQTAPLTVRR
jgi:hypothetical protein